MCIRDRYGCEGTISDCNFINNTADNGAAYRLGDDNKGVSSASVDTVSYTHLDVYKRQW